MRPADSYDEVYVSQADLWQTRGIGSPCEGRFQQDGASCMYARSLGHRDASVNTHPWIPYAPRPVTAYRSWRRSEVYPRVVYGFYSDHYLRDCPGESYPPNPFNVYDTWEWTNLAASRFLYYGNFTDFTPVINHGREVVTRRILSDMAEEGRTNLGLAFLERKKTASLIGGYFRNIASFVTDFRKRLRGGTWRELVDLSEQIRIGRALDAVQGRPPRKVPRYNFKRKFKDLTDREKFLMEIPKRFLEFKYGVQPLMRDIYSLANSVDLLQQENRFFFSKSHKFRQQGSGYPEFGGCLGGTAFAVPTNWTVDVQMRVFYHLRTDWYQTLVGQGVTNPLSTAWDIIPYSFIIDQCFKVSEFLETLDATQGKEFHSGYMTTFIREQDNGQWKFVDFAHNVSPHHKSGSIMDTAGALYQLTDMNRIKLYDFPSPVKPAVKLPSLTNLAEDLSLLALAFGASLPRTVR